MCSRNIFFPDVILLCSWKWDLQITLCLATNEQQLKMTNFLMCNRVIRRCNKRHAGGGKKAYSTWYSQAVSHPSTDQDQPWLPRTDEIGHVQGGVAVSDRLCDKCASQMYHVVPLYNQIIGLRGWCAADIFSSLMWSFSATENETYRSLCVCQQISSS